MEFIAVVIAVVAMITAVKASNRTFTLEKDLTDLRAELSELRARLLSTASDEENTKQDLIVDANTAIEPMADTSSTAENHPMASNRDSLKTDAVKVSSPHSSIPSNEPLSQQTKEQAQRPNTESLSEATESESQINQTPTHHGQTQYHRAELNDVTGSASINSDTEEPLSNSFDRGMIKLEASFRENWLVWVGALAMLVGGGYLIQVIGSRIEFSPMMRVAIAFSLSALMIVAGEWFHRKEQKNPERAIRSSSFSYVPAAITGTGLTGIYCTVIFAFVFYQLLAPSTSLLILAIAAFSSLALSLRQGPLMAALGLIGGYTAPFWIGGSAPNYFLLAGYITAITIAGTVLMQWVKRPWLTPSVSAPHLLWMLLLIEGIPQQQLFTWLAIFLTVTTYLLFAVPRLGWPLNPRFRHRQTSWSNQPVVMSLAMVALLFWAIDNMAALSAAALVYAYALLTALAWLPALRRGVSMRIFYPSTLVMAVALLLMSLGIFALDMWQSERQILMCLGTTILLVAVRTISQFTNGDRSLFSRLMLLLLAPAMTVLTLGFVKLELPQELSFWSIFTVLLAGLYVQLGTLLPQLRSNVSACIHGMVLSLSFVWLNDSALTTAISAQVAVMAVQAQYQRFQPAYWAIKVAMGLLVIRLTLLPFIPDWQPSANASWTWSFISYLPPLMLLGYARVVLRRVNTDIANWFEGAFLHVFLIALFTQTNYWLTGSYGFSTNLDFISAIVYANQALVMAIVYGYRSQFADKLNLIYRGYSMLLLIAFAALVAVLNTRFSPLIVDTVLATAWPIFNMMTLGWLLPGAILLGLAVYRLPFFGIPSRAFAVSGIGILGLWLVMSIRQFWQASSMTVFNTTSMAELFSYSIVGLLIGALTTWVGVTRSVLQIQRVGLLILGGVTLKVFLLDVGFLEGFWRAISFLGLGAALISLGWLFQKLNKSVAEMPPSE